MNALALIFALAAQDAAPVVESAPPAAAPIDDVDAQYSRTHAVLEAFADEARAARITGAVTSGVLGAGLIGAGITYVAVSHLDGQLAQKDSEDTQLAGFVIGGAALIPASIMVAQIVTSSPEEERLVAFEENASTRALKKQRVDEARASIAQQATASALAPTLGGVAFIAGGLVSAAAGGVFLALPHIPDVERGVMTHATGAELIGAGVSSVGVGTALLFAGNASSAPLQMRLLESNAAAAAAAAAE